MHPKDAVTPWMYAGEYWLYILLGGLGHHYKEEEQHVLSTRLRGELSMDGSQDVLAEH